MSIVNNLRIYDINRRLYPEIINSMPNVKASIINYSDFYYVSINNYLRKIKSTVELSEKDLSDIRFQITNLDNAINIYQDLLHEYKLDRTLKVYRILHFRDREIQEKEMSKFESGIYLDEGFMSSSIKPNGYQILGSSIKLEIDLTTLNYGAFIGNLSKFRTESEFLIRRGVPFKVLNIKEVPGHKLIKLKSF